jgi:hypothetical protein
MEKDQFIKIGDGKRLSTFVEKNYIDVSLEYLSEDGWSFTSVETLKIIERMKRVSISLQTYVNGHMFRGIITGLNEAFVIDKPTRDKIIKEDSNSSEIIKPMLAGKNVRRYSSKFTDRYLIWTYIGVPIEKYPGIFNHLSQYKDRLKKRWDQGNHWWELRGCDYYDLFKQPKIIYPDIATTCRFTVDNIGFFSVNTTYFIPGEDLYLLGILNSKVSNFYLSEVCAGLESSGSIYLRFFGQYLGNFPLRKIDPSNYQDKTKYDKMVALVQSILQLHISLEKVKTPTEKKVFQRQIETTDQQIDALVYELYGLTDKEIQIVNDRYST